MSGRCPSPATVNGRAIATAPPARSRVWQSRSTTTLLSAYPPRGRTGSVSADGRPSRVPPYTEDEEVTTSGVAGGTAASTAAVASTLSRYRRCRTSGRLSRTPGQPARWNTTSALASAACTSSSRSSRSAVRTVRPS